MTTDADIVDAELVDQPSSELAIRPEAPANLFRSDNPTEVIAKATAHATVLADVVRQRKLVTRIQGSEHVQVEGWTLLGSMLGVFPVTVWTKPTDDGWEARVEARTLTGQVVGAAEAQCLRSERTWKSRDDYALRSMAQTRATSKALRMPLGFIMQLAGFNPTPADEMPTQEVSRQEPPRRGTPPAATPRPAPPDSDGRRMISDGQRAALHATFNDIGVKDRDAKLRVLAHFKDADGNPVDSSNGLSWEQASALIEKCKANPAGVRKAAGLPEPEGR